MARHCPSNQIKLVVKEKKKDGTPMELVTFLISWIDMLQTLQNGVARIVIKSEKISKFVTENQMKLDIKFVPLM
jgi:hypothetical protein